MVSSVLHTPSLCARVWLVLAYSAVFEFPLTTTEVRRRYWIFAKELFPSEKQVAQALRTLRSMGYIKKTGVWWHLSSQPQAPKNRARWQRYSVQKKLESQAVVEFLSKFPWVVGVAITGSVAVDSAREDDDVDFLIVTKPNRLWLTRIVTLLFAMKHGKRRSFAHEEPNSWCFNLWLTTESLGVSQERRSIYTAFEVCQADWMLARKSIISKYFLENTWAKNVIPSFYRFSSASNDGQLSQQILPEESDFFLITKIEMLGNGSFLFVIDYIVGVFQRLYMKQHQTNEVVDRQKAFFHPRNTSLQIRRGIIRALLTMGCYVP